MESKCANDRIIWVLSDISHLDIGEKSQDIERCSLRMNEYQLKKPQQIDQTEESYLDHHRIWLCFYKPTRLPIAKYLISLSILSTIHFQNLPGPKAQGFA